MRWLSSGRCHSMCWSKETVELVDGSPTACVGRHLQGRRLHGEEAIRCACSTLVRVFSEGAVVPAAERGILASMNRPGDTGTAL